MEDKLLDYLDKTFYNEPKKGKSYIKLPEPFTINETLEINLACIVEDAERDIFNVFFVGHDINTKRQRTVYLYNGELDPETMRYCLDCLKKNFDIISEKVKKL